MRSQSMREKRRLGTELFDVMPADEKALVFCVTQEHALRITHIIREETKRRGFHAAHYCERVTADDGAVGERLYTYTSNLHLAFDLSSRRASAKNASRGGAFDIMAAWKRSFIPFAPRFRISVSA